MAYMTNEGQIERDKDNMKNDLNECGVKTFLCSITAPVPLLAKNIKAFAFPIPWLQILWQV